MGGRYYLTGVQIGMIQALAEKREFTQIKNLIKEVQDKQYICEKEEFERLKYKEAKETLNKLKEKGE